MIRGVAAAVVCAALVASCSSDSRTVTPPSATTTSSSPASTTTTTPCTPAFVYPIGTTHHYTRVDGLRREYLVHMPPHAQGPRPRTMLIVDFHGATSNMQQQAAYTGFDQLADANDFVVATPNATGPAAARQWNFLGRPDIDFAIRLVHELVAGACVDPGRVFATGISSGGAMTASLACVASGTFDGFAPVAADFYNARFCGHATPRPFLIFHGTADRVVPYDGGRVGALEGRIVRPAEQSAEQWALHNGCDPNRVEEQLSSEVVRFTWSGCTQPVVMYKIVGGGHTWPGATIAVRGLGRTTSQISASAEIVKAFSAL